MTIDSAYQLMFSEYWQRQAAVEIFLQKVF